jgi:hypothetical protein
VANKYEPLTALLRAASARGQRTVELDFEAIAMAVGGLPPSSDVRQWWANSSQVQALVSFLRTGWSLRRSPCTQ